MTASSLVTPGLRVAWGPSHEREDADRLLDELVGSHLGTSRPVGRRCPLCGSTAHGRPVVDAGLGLSVSLSRSPGLAVAALSTVGDVGIDVEAVGSAAFDGFDEVALHPDDAAADPTLTWVRKEALLKAAGRGLTVDPRRVRLDDAGQLVAWDGRLPDPSRCRVTDLDLPAGYVGAVAVVATP